MTTKEILDFYGARLEKSFFNDTLTEMFLTSKKPLIQSQIDQFFWETKKHVDVDTPIIWCDNITSIWIDPLERVLIVTINNKVELEIDY